MRNVPSRPPWWMFVLAALFVAYHLLLLHSDLGRPEPVGFVLGVQDSEIVVRAVAPGSRAAGAGLEAGDRLLTANSHPLGSRLDWVSVEMNLRSNQPLRLEVARDGGRQTIVFPLNRAPRRYWATPAGATLVSVRGVQLITLVLALVVAFKRPFDRSARVGAWVLATLAVYSIAFPYQVAATWRALPAVIGIALWIPFASSLALVAVLFTFFVTFPRPMIRSRWTWLAVWAPMASVLFLQLQFAGRVVYRPDQAYGFIDWAPISAAVTTGYTIAALAVLIVGYRRLTDVTERRRVRVLAVGSSVGLISAVAIVGSYWGRSDVSLGYSIFTSPVVAVGAIVALMLPGSFAYAVLRHRLFDVSLIVRLGLQYALARRVLVSMVPATAAIFLADLWINRQIPFVEIVRERGWAYLSLAGLAVIARLRRKVWLDRLDRRFFRERLNVQRLLLGIGDEVRTATGLGTVAPRVVTKIEAALHPRFVALLVRRPDEPLYRPVATAPATTDLEPLETLSSESKAVGLLQWVRKPIQLPADERWLRRHLPSDELDSLRRANIDLLVPVRFGSGAAEALFALGPKRSEEPYSAEDEDLLMAIGNNLALLLAHESAPLSERDVFEECPACGLCYNFGAGRCTHDDSALTVTSLPRLLGGRYQLDRRVGRGGMGTVYAARDTALERHVAAKLLREDLVGPGEAERFQGEARLGAALAHPNVVTVHDIGVTASGRAFFIMELLEGVTLREELRRKGQLAPARVLHIVHGICAAVDAAHRRQMIHRDLKPENVFLCRNDAVEIPKVLDFGLAKALEVSGGIALTVPGLVAGTPQYMAPEHLSGEEPSPDWDLWAVGVMTFEMITGVLPFTGGPGKLRHIDDLPPGLQQLFSRTLSTNPIDRPTSAQEFSDALDHELVCNELPS
jgi:eukaryotic-like serine/threonine-protein kinase